MSNTCNAGNGAVYGMGFLGALVYNIQYASGASEILWGIFKSMLWPVFLVHGLLSFLQL